MAVRVETITDLLEAHQWAVCADLAAQLLCSSETPAEDKAFLHFARCRSLSHQEKYSLALEPGQLAVYLASENRDYDLLGNALLELAWVQHKVPGMEHVAVETQRRFIEHFPMYKTIRDRYLSVQLNLGVYLRSAGRFEAAFEQFRQTYDEAKVRRSHEVAGLACSYAVWEALRLGRITDAEELLQPSKERQTGDPRLQAMYLMDRAQLALLKRHPQVACELVLQAVPLIRQVYKDDGHLLPQALEILHRVAVEHGDDETAVVVALLAKRQAEQDDRQDLIRPLVASIRSIALRNPQAIERAMKALGL